MMRCTNPASAPIVHASTGVIAAGAERPAGFENGEKSTVPNCTASFFLLKPEEAS